MREPHSILYYWYIYQCRYSKVEEIALGRNEVEGETNNAKAHFSPTWTPNKLIQFKIVSPLFYLIYFFYYHHFVFFSLIVCHWTNTNTCQFMLSHWPSHTLLVSLFVSFSQFCSSFRLSLHRPSLPSISSKFDWASAGAFSLRWIFIADVQDNAMLHGMATNRLHAVPNGSKRQKSNKSIFRWVKNKEEKNNNGRKTCWLSTFLNQILYSNRLESIDWDRLQHATQLSRNGNSGIVVFCSLFLKCRK